MRQTEVQAAPKAKVGTLAWKLRSPSNKDCYVPQSMPKLMMVNEYSSLKDGVLYSWGELGLDPLFLCVGGLWLATLTVLGVPIAAASFDPSSEPLTFILAAGTGTLLFVSLILLRIYLGWSYVGDRLLSASVPYEESGWYDGQMSVKPPEILARDRLFGSYKTSGVGRERERYLDIGNNMLHTWSNWIQNPA